MKNIVLPAIILLIAVLTLAPALDASLYADDFFFIALARNAGSPLDYLTNAHFFGGHLFRPVPMMFWWWIEHFTGSVQAQYFCNALLLGFCGVAIFSLLRELGLSRTTAFAFALVYVLLPANVATALWLADRFDLMATTFLLAGMAVWVNYVRSGKTWMAWHGLVLFGLAALSKELSYIFPLILSLELAALWQSRHISPTKPGLGKLAFSIVAYCLLLAGIVAWKTHIGVLLVPPSVGGQDLTAILLHSSLKWWQALPAALVYARAPAADIPKWLGMAMAGVCAAVLVTGWRLTTPAQGYQSPQRMGLVLGMAILFLVPLVQAPHFIVTEVEFATPQGMMSRMFVERFFFFGSSGLLLLVACGSRPLCSRCRRCNGDLAGWFIALIFVPIIGWCLVRDYAIASDWPLASSRSSTLAKAAAVAATQAVHRTGMPCRLVFLDSGDPVFQAAAEPMVKVLAADPDVDRCVIETETRPLITLTAPAALDWYRLKALTPYSHKVVNVFGWWLIPGDLVISNVGDEHTQRFALDKATGTFRIR